MSEPNSNAAESDVEATSSTGSPSSPYLNCKFHVPYAALKKIQIVEEEESAGENATELLVRTPMLTEETISEKKKIEETANKVAKLMHQSSNTEKPKNSTLTEIISGPSKRSKQILSLFEHLKTTENSVNSTINLEQQNRRKSLPEFPFNEDDGTVSTQPKPEPKNKKYRKSHFSIITVPTFLQNVKSKNLDTLLNLIGSFGMYQKFEFFLIGFLAILPSMVAYSYVFVSATPKFTCMTAREVNKISLSIDTKSHATIYNSNYFKSIKSIENTIENHRIISILSQEQIKNHESNGTKIEFDSTCKLNPSHYPQFFKKDANWLNREVGSFFDTNGNRIMTNMSAKIHSSKLTCVEWYFDSDLYGRTLVSDWNLVCVRSHLKAMTQNTFIIGTGCSVFTGILSDKFGRRTVMMTLIFVMFCVLNITQILMHSEALSVNTKIILFTISRFFQGVASSMFTISFVLLLEITGPKHRVTAGNIVAYSFSIGQMIIVALAYAFKDWRKVQWVLALYILPFFCYYWLVPESPRWLLSVGKVEEARRVLVKITRINLAFSVRWFKIRQRFSYKHNQKNLVEIESSTSQAYMFTLLQEEANKLNSMKSNNNYANTLRGILKSPLLIRRCLIIFYTWMIILAVYLGIGMGISGNLDKIMSPYKVFFIAAICEFISIVTCHLVLNRFGRKYPLIIFMFISSIAIYLIPVYYHNYPYVSIVFYFLAKYSIGAAQGTFLIYTSELYPTPMRSTGVGMSVAIARVGGVWAPQLNVIDSTIGNFNTPFMIFSFFCLLSAFFCLFLPETLNKSLPENTLQATLLNQRSNK